jgi:hypothetical protein
MSRAFVLGNGVSRQLVDLNNLRHLGQIYGCNALYRDFVPDVLVSTDKPISTRIQDSGYPHNNRFYTRRPVPGNGANPVPQKYYGYSSGPIAASIAALDGAVVIYLVGFDMGPVNNHFNNVYADTEFYKKSSALPTFTGNWARQLTQIMRDFSTIAFVRVMGPTTSPVADFADVRNFRTMSMEDFQNRINNTKDL